MDIGKKLFLAVMVLSAAPAFAQQAPGAGNRPPITPVPGPIIRGAPGPIAAAGAPFLLVVAGAALAAKRWRKKR